MNNRGIRILDNVNGHVSVRLPDVLEEIHSGDQLHWSILYLWAIGDLGNVDQTEISHYDRGLIISWADLNRLAQNIYQTIDLVLIGDKNESFLHRYESDEIMHRTCHVVIEMIDSSYWEIFSVDNGLIDRLVKKFKQIEFIEDRGPLEA